jgi:methyl-accepting chemotaxis protein
MKSVSIKTKVILVLTLSLAIGATILVGLVRNSYDKNVGMVAQSALQSAQKTFDNLKADRLASLTLASAGFVNNDTVRDLFLKRDREGLYAYLAPAFEDMKTMGTGFLLFLEPDGTAFLRMHAPKSFGDSLKFGNVEEAIKKQSTVMAVDLVKPGLVTQTVRPYRDKSGALIGFVIVSSTFDKFLTNMKSQTGDEYVSLGYKSFLDERLYRNSQKAKGLPDTWDQFGTVAVLGRTIEVYDQGEYEKDLIGLPPEGKLLGEVRIGDGVFIRGVFPLYDTSGKAMGGIFVRHDISPLHAGMQKVQTTAIVAIVILMLVLSISIALILNKLVFARLRHTMNVATRVVGGEFGSAIVATSDDEVGQLEQLFEQFRTIFVGVVDDLSARQAADEKKGAASGS